MKSSEKSLIRAIIENPDDDEPRLAYADWLDSQGDPRGEFIRVQLRLDGFKPLERSVEDELADREEQLLKAHDAQWTKHLEPLVPNAVRAGFHRGFIEEISLHSELEAEKLGIFDVLEREPLVRTLSIQNHKPSIDVLQKISKLDQLDMVYFEENAPLDAEGLALLEPLSCLTTVRVESGFLDGTFGAGITKEQFQAFLRRRLAGFESLPKETRQTAAKRYLRSVEERWVSLDLPRKTVRFSQVLVFDEETKLLAELPEIEKVAFFESFHISSAALEPLSRLPRLRELALDITTVESLAPLAKCKTLGRLSVSPEYDTILGDRGTQGLEQLENLQSLRLWDRGASDVTMERIARLSKIEELEISLGQLSDEGIGLLTRLPNLKTLRFSGKMLNDRNIQYLGKLDSLKRVEIEWSSLTSAGAKALKKQLPSTTVIVNGKEIQHHR